MNTPTQPTFQHVAPQDPGHLWMTCPVLLVTPGLPVRRRGADHPNGWTAVMSVDVGAGRCEIHGSSSDSGCPISELEIDLLDPHVRDYIVRAIARAAQLGKERPVVGLSAGRFFRSWLSTDRVWFLEIERNRAEMGSIVFCQDEGRRPRNRIASPPTSVVLVPALAEVNMSVADTDERALGLIAWRVLNAAQVAEQIPEVSS